MIEFEHSNMKTLMLCFVYNSLSSKDDNPLTSTCRVFDLTLSTSFEVSNPHEGLQNRLELLSADLALRYMKHLQIGKNYSWPT